MQLALGDGDKPRECIIPHYRIIYLRTFNCFTEGMQEDYPPAYLLVKSIINFRAT